MAQKIGVEAIWNNKQFLQGQSEYVSKITQASSATGNIASSMGGLSSAGGLLAGVLGGVVGGVMSAATSAMLSFASSVVQATTDVVNFGIHSVAQLQDLSITLETLSARELLQSGTVETMGEAMQYAGAMAAGLMERIKTLSLASPFEYKDILNTFQLSMGFGMASKSALEFTRAVTNVAAVNKSIPNILERITYNFSQMSLVGKITARDIRDLAQAGVNLAAVMQEGLGMTIDEVNAALEAGAITMEDVGKAFVTYSDKYFSGAAERSSRTLSGLASSFKDLAFFASSSVFGPALETISRALGDVFDVARKIVDSGVLDNIGAVLGLVADGAVSAAGKFAAWVTGMADEWGGKLEEVANDAFEWGANIAINLATGLIQGAASALTYAMNWISSLLSSWLAPGSPPKVAPDLPEWGEAAMGEWLNGMTNADFDVLNAIQNPLRDVLGTIVDMGDLTKDEMGQIFGDISKQIIQALSTGVIDESLFDQIRASAGEFGDELVDLARKQIELAQAEEEVADAENDLADARKREQDAGKKVNQSVAEYNKLLRSGASKDVLEAKLKEINANKQAQTQAQAEAAAAEERVDAAKENLDLMKEQVKTMQELLATLLELARAEIPTPELPETPGGGGAPSLPGGGGATVPPIDLSGLEDQIGAKVEEIKQMILDKLGGVWEQLKAIWSEKIAPLLEPLSTAWNNLMTQLQPVIDFIEIGWGNFLIWLGGETKYWLDFAQGWWDKHGQSIITIAQWFSDSVKRLITNFLTMISDLWKLYGGDISQIVNDSLELIRTFFSDFFETIGPGIDAFAELTEGDWQGFWDKIAEIQALGQKSTISIGQLFWKILGGIWKIGTDFIGRAWNAIWTVISDRAKLIWNDITGWIDTKVNEIKTTITGVITSIQTWWDTTWTTIQTKISDIWTGIQTKISEILTAIDTFIRDTIEKLFEAMGLDLDEMSARWSQIWTDVQIIASTVWQRIYDAVSGKITEVKTWIQTEIDLIKSYWSTKWEEISTTVSTIWQTIYDAVSGKIQEIWGSLFGTDGKVTAIQNEWGTKWGEIVTTISTKWEEIKTAIGTKAQEIWNSLFGEEGYISGIATEIAGYVQDMFDAGANLITGMKDGVLSVVGDLIEAITSAIEDAIEAANKALGIESPSKVFSAIGKNTMNALAQGIDVTTNLPKLAMQNATVGIIPTAPIPVYNGNSYRSMNLTVNNQINGQMDLYSLQANVIRWVRDAMRR